MARRGRKGTGPKATATFKRFRKAPKKDRGIHDARKRVSNAIRILGANRRMKVQGPFVYEIEDSEAT